MARTAIPGGIKGVEDGTEADTNGFGTVTIMMLGTAASASVAVTVGDTSGSLAACPESDLIDPTTGDPVTLSGGDGDIRFASYIGPCRYVEATGSNATAVVILGEARMTGPE